MPYLVMGAGDAEFDGFYEVDTTRIGGKRDRNDTAACYRKVGSSCTMNYNRTDHAWFMCKDHRGAWYKNTTDSDVPPASGWTRANQGKAPPPTIQFAGCAGLLSVQPLALRVKQARVPGASVDGLYVIDVEKGETDGVACYRRVNSSETLHRHNGTWFISTRYDHRSSWFEVASSARLPPVVGWRLGVKSAERLLGSLPDPPPDPTVEPERGFDDAALLARPPFAAAVRAVALGRRSKAGGSGTAPNSAPLVGTAHDGAPTTAPRVGTAISPAMGDGVNGMDMEVAGVAEGGARRAVGLAGMLQASGADVRMRALTSNQLERWSYRVEMNHVPL